jgi:hypothetical protein
LLIVATENLEVVHIDIKTAFLTADLDYPIYMTQPEGFVEIGGEYNRCLIRKAIFETKQAPYLFGEKLKT